MPHNLIMTHNAYVGTDADGRQVQLYHQPDLEWTQGTGKIVVEGGEPRVKIPVRRACSRAQTWDFLGLEQPDDTRDRTLAARFFQGNTVPRGAELVVEHIFRSNSIAEMGAAAPLSAMRVQTNRNSIDIEANKRMGAGWQPYTRLCAEVKYGKCFSPPKDYDFVLTSHNQFKSLNGCWEYGEGYYLKVSQLTDLNRTLTYDLFLPEIYHIVEETTAAHANLLEGLQRGAEERPAPPPPAVDRTTPGNYFGGGAAEEPSRP